MFALNFFFSPENARDNTEPQTSLQTLRGVNYNIGLMVGPASHGQKLQNIDEIVECIPQLFSKSYVIYGFIMR